MRRFLGDLGLFLAVLSAGAVLLLAAAFDPGGFRGLAGWLTLAAYAVPVAVLAARAASRETHVLGLFPMAGGFALLALAAGAGLWPDAGPTVTAWTRDRVPVDAVPWILRAAGALGVALGFLLWSSRLLSRAVRAEQRDDCTKAHATDVERRLRQAERQLEETLSHDDVTGALKRQAFLKRLDEVVQRDSRLSRPFAFMLVHVVDYRKQVTEGRNTRADELIRQVAKAVRGSTRGTDHTGRISEDQFAVVLGECENARPAVDRLLLSLSAVPDRKPEVRIAVVSVPEPHFDVTPSDLFRLAHEGMATLRGTSTSLCAHRTWSRPRPRPAAL